MTTPKTDADLQACYRELVNSLYRWTKVGSIPLAPEAQVRFIQSAFYMVETIRESEPFLRGEVVATLEKVTAHYVETKPIKSPKPKTL